MHPKKLKTTRFPQVLQHWSEAISQISNTCAFMSVHWLVLYCLYHFLITITTVGSYLWHIAWLEAKQSRDTSSRDTGVTGVGRIAICNLWSILAEVAGMKGKWGRPLCPFSRPFSNPPPLLALCSAHPRGGLVSPEGRTCCRAGRQFSGWLLLLSSRLGPRENKLTKQRTAN